MGAVSLELLKQHVRADEFGDDDAYLRHLCDTAQAWVVNATNRSEEELRAMEGGNFPLPLCQAVLMLAGHWYNQREAVSAANMTEVPYSVQALIRPYRRLTACRPEE